jgi:exodeoxyribonuclease V alpha subunit
MQIRNNYDLEIFNGDIGRVETFLEEESEIVVRFDGRPVRIPFDDLDELIPAYACTIHKAQGSEYPAVVIVLHHQHHVMLQRNLLYTAVTRGRRLVVIIGSRRALGRAVSNNTQRRRFTLLADRLANRLP